MDMKDTVENIAKLAHLNLTKEKKDEFASQFEKIIGYIDEINKLDLEGIEPLAHVIETENVLREDKIKPGLTLEQALSNAPKKNDTFFKVPKVLE